MYDGDKEAREDEHSTAIISRITVDIDSHVPSPRLRVLRAVKRLERAGATDTKVAVSSSGDGFHVVGHFDRHVSVDERFRIRRNANDDPNRIRMDRQRAERGLPISTMWRKKGANRGERQVFDTADAAFGHAALSTDWTERAKSINNHGHKAATDALTPHLSEVSAP